jgi:putative heme degradation protein
MSKVKLYTPDRLTLHAVAADYLKANPDTTHNQLMQLFALTTLESRDVRRSVHAQDAVKAETMKAAIAWAIENMAGCVHVGERFGLSDGNARRVALAAKAINAEKIAAAKASSEAARKFADDNPQVFTRDVAAQFGVSLHMLEKHRAKRRIQFAVIAIDSHAAEAMPQRKQGRGNRLYAVMDDGSMFDPRKCREVRKAIRFTGVAV